MDGKKMADRSLSAGNLSFAFIYVQNFLFQKKNRVVKLGKILRH